MAGGRQAPSSGAALESAVYAMAHEMGLRTARQVRVGRRLWGAVRKIDLVLRSTKTAQSLGVECKYQGSGGSAEEKIPATIQDIGACGPWRNPREHRERRGARLARRDKGAYRPYATAEQRSQAGCIVARMPRGLSPRAAWPIPGIVVFAGDGFSDNMRSYLHSTGRAVALEDLRDWLALFFGLPDSAGRATD